MTALETLKCYTHGKKNTDKVEISVWALNRIINALSQEPTSEMVHVETLRQVMWERDIAIEQLHELGYEWGQKIEPCDDWRGVPSDEMTLEQARQAVKDLRKKLAEYLDQQPCDDVVSRILKRMWNCRGKHTTSIDKVAMEQIIRDELPPVTQKCEKCAMNGSGSKYCDNCGQKSGKWIKSIGYIGDVKCSICSKEYDQDVLYDANYCPNCGARMESEDKE